MQLQRSAVPWRRRMSSGAKAMVRSDRRRGSKGEPSDHNGTGPAPGARGSRRARPPAATPRDLAELSDHRPSSIPVGDDRARASPVHRHRQRSGTTLQSGSPPLGVRLLEAGEQLLRFRHRSGHGACAQLPDRQADLVSTGSPGAQRARAPAGGEGARWRSGKTPRLSPALGGERLGNELWGAERCSRDRAQRGRRHRRVSAQHGRGWPYPPSSSWR